MNHGNGTNTLTAAYRSGVQEGFAFLLLVILLSESATRLFGIHILVSDSNS